MMKERIPHVDQRGLAIRPQAAQWMGEQRYFVEWIAESVDIRGWCQGLSTIHPEW